MKVSGKCFLGKQIIDLVVFSCTRGIPKLNTLPNNTVNEGSNVHLYKIHFMNISSPVRGFSYAGSAERRSRDLNGGF